MKETLRYEDLLKARERLDQKPDHKTFKELQAGCEAEAGIKLDTHVHKTSIPTVKEEPNYSQITKAFTAQDLQDTKDTIEKTLAHKPLGFINKSNMIRFVVPTVTGICLGSMLQGTLGTMAVFMLVFGVLGVAGAVMSS